PSKGPARRGSLDEGAAMAPLVPNRNWWGRAPKLDHLVFHVGDQSEQPRSSADGEIDLLERNTGDVLRRAEDRDDAIIRRTHGVTGTDVTLNTQGRDGALEDVKVREAIARGIDRVAIGRAGLEPVPSAVVLVD